MDLGLTALGSNRQVSMEEFLMDYYEGFLALEAEEVQLNALCDAYQSLESISNCIKKHGVTQSLETLYGENFTSASTMGFEAEEAKSNIFRRIWETIKRWFIKFCNWVKAFFNKTDAIISRLDKIADNPDGYKFPLEVYPTGVAVDSIKATLRDKIEAEKKEQTGVRYVPWSELKKAAKEEYDKLIQSNTKVHITSPQMLSNYCKSLSEELKKNKKRAQTISEYDYWAVCRK